MKPAELLNNLTVEYMSGRPLSNPGKEAFVSLIYIDSDPQRAMRIVDMVGKVASESHSRIGYSNSVVPKTREVPHPSKSALKHGGITLGIGLGLWLILKRRELKYVLSTRGAARDATYYLWGKGYAYYLSLGQTIPAKATVAVRLFVAVALNIASLIGGGGSKPAPFD